MGRRAIPFFDRVEKTPTCWIWTGPLGKEGYANRWYEGRLQKAHRVAYQMLVGPIPDGMELDHLCRNPACVNPDHLEPVTTAENNRRRVLTPVAACPRGHAYTPENTYTPPSNPSARMCRTCLRARKGGSYYRWKARKLEKART